MRTAQLGLISGQFDSVRLAKFGVSSIKFDYRTQSKSIERLESDWVRLTTLGIYNMNT